MSTFFTSDKFLDFHTHSLRRKDNPNITEIVSLHLGKEKEYELFTIGKHPWWTTSKLTTVEHQKLISFLTSKKCLAMGEMGLDKLKGEPMENQIEIFKELLGIAEETEKPVIIHCVRAFDQLIKLRRTYPKIKKWCVHGFSRHATLAKQLIHEGFYISLMPVSKINQKYIDLVEYLPLEKFFLETDSMPNTKIENIYLQVATIKKISVEELKLQMMSNARHFFNFSNTEH